MGLRCVFLWSNCLVQRGGVCNCPTINGLVSIYDINVNVEMLGSADKKEDDDLILLNEPLCTAVV